jgi:uncharacterized repeat protein (TIGR04138 family)
MSDPREDYEVTLDRLVTRDRRYTREAYLFVQASLDYYQQRHGSGRPTDHITGPDLLRGVRELALSEYGPMAHLVLNHWGLQRGEDVGEVVYNLIEVGLMTKTQEDRREDFAGVMVFDEAMARESTW